MPVLRYCKLPKMHRNQSLRQWLPACMRGQTSPERATIECSDALRESGEQHRSMDKQDNGALS